MQSTEAEISLSGIARNAEEVCRAAGRPLIAVVKDDGYGHGAARVAHTLSSLAAMFAVATVEEGARLRVSGVDVPILVLTPALTADEAVRAVRYGLLLSLSSADALDLVIRAGVPAEAHLAVNTGMNRYGFPPQGAGAACLAAKRAGIRVTGIYSHLYLPEDGAARAEQLALFARACAQAREVFPQITSHFSATGGLVAGEDGADMVRVGLALYGYQPSYGTLSLSPAMRVYATVSQGSLTPVGGGAGYRRAERAYPSLHTLRYGYGDGFVRTGGVCMDACIEEGEGRFGERRLLFSDARVYAERHGLSVYEVLVRTGRGAVRRYIP